MLTIPLIGDALTFAKPTLSKFCFDFIVVPLNADVLSVPYPKGFSHVLTKKNYISQIEHLLIIIKIKIIL